MLLAWCQHGAPSWARLSGLCVCMCVHYTRWSLRRQMAVHSRTVRHVFTPSLFLFVFSDIYGNVAAGGNNATASCQACNAGETVQAFCVDHPDVNGCQQRMFACVLGLLPFLPLPLATYAPCKPLTASHPRIALPPFSRPQNGMGATRFATKQRALAMATAPGSHSTALEEEGGRHRHRLQDALLGRPCKASAKRKGPVSPLLTSSAIMLR